MGSSKSGVCHLTQSSDRRHELNVFRNGWHSVVVYTVALGPLHDSYPRNEFIFMYLYFLLGIRQWQFKG